MKRFVIKTICMSLPLVLGIAFFYFIFWREIPYMRDFGHLGMIIFDKDYRSCVDIPDTNYVENLPLPIEWENDSLTIVTIGDSFSQQGNGGYQNYLAMALPDYKIYNLCECNMHANQEFIQLTKQGKLPRVVIVESVERFCVTRLTEQNVEGVDTEIRPHGLANPDKRSGKSFLGWAQEFYKKNLGIDNPVGRLMLSDTMFSCKGNEKDLYYINIRIDSDVKSPSLERVYEARQCLQELIDFAEKNGIELYYLVAMDKYDAYQKYVVNNPFPPKVVLDSLAVAFTNDRHFVNSKEIIQPYIDAREIDMWYCDDSHWSPKSAKLVATELARRIQMGK